MQLNRTNAQIIKRTYHSQYIEKYTVGLKKSKYFSEFRKMEVVENHTIIHRSGDVTKVRDDNFIDIGKKLFHKLKNGSGTNAGNAMVAALSLNF